MTEDKNIHLIQDVFDHIYLINVPTQTDRLEAVKAELEEHDIYDKVEIVSAMTGLDVSDEFKVPEDDKTDGWNNNAVALSLTTARIIKDAKAKGYKNIFIFEDDAKLTKNFCMLFNNVWESLPKNFDFLHLNANHFKQSKYFKPYLKKITYAWCCQAYGISAHMYDIYLEELEKCLIPIDQITGRLHETRDNSYSSSVNIVYHQENQYSTLRGKIVNY